LSSLVLWFDLNGFLRRRFHRHFTPAIIVPSIIRTQHALVL